MTEDDIREALAARDIAAAIIDTDCIGVPASPAGKSRPLHPDTITQGLLDAGTDLAVSSAAERNARLSLADWIKAADEAGWPKTEIARLSGLSRGTVYAALGLTRGWAQNN